MIFKSLIITAIVICISVAYLLITPISSFCDEDAYSKIVPIGGIVSTTEIENGKVFEAQKKAILFQRIDCKKCLFSVVTDAEGKYQAYVSEGKYQIIVRDCGRDKNKDCIAPNQSRHINAKLKANPQFDIKLVHSKEDAVITLPPIEKQ
jgi:hypothetical protein